MSAHTGAGALAARLARFVVSIALWTLGQPLVAQPPDLASVRAEALHTYYHGITPELARERIGAAGVPALLQLLGDPAFPRRDNVVAFVGFLGGVEATDGLLRFLAAPPAPLTAPEEDRALLLLPQSLGHIASRGERRALEALLRMTAGGGGGEALATVAARTARPAAIRDDLLEQALLGLIYARNPRAAARLRAIESGALRPAARGRDLRAPAREALRLLDRLEGRAPAAIDRGGRRLDGQDSARLDGGLSRPGAGAGLAPRAFDGAHSNVQQSLLTYANHPAVTSPMGNTRLDAALADVSLYLGRADFIEDVGCCAGLARSGDAETFGSMNDGLDTIDNNTELNAVLNDPVARVKVVRIINYCSGPGSNIIGCAWINGNGMSLVRYGNETNEGQLWAHEYGHNIGLSTTTTSLRHVLLPVRHQLRADADRVQPFPHAGDRRRADAGQPRRLHRRRRGRRCRTRSTTARAPSNNPQTDGNDDGIGDVCEDGCGNDILDSGEECDVSRLDGESCVSQGYPGGTLRCRLDCTFDESDCTGGPTKTATATPTITRTPTTTPTRTRTPTPSRTATQSVTPTRTATVTVTPTRTPSPTRTSTATSTPTSTPTSSSTATPALTATATSTTTATATATVTPSATATSTTTPTATPTATITVTATATAIDTSPVLDLDGDGVRRRAHRRHAGGAVVVRLHRPAAGRGRGSDRLHALHRARDRGPLRRDRGSARHRWRR